MQKLLRWEEKKRKTGSSDGSSDGIKMKTYKTIILFTYIIQNLMYNVSAQGKQTYSKVLTRKKIMTIDNSFYWSKTNLDYWLWYKCFENEFAEI